ncbi:MAG: heme-binding domain-containing protein [Candidatus Promineifilaceae bacterium]
MLRKIAMGLAAVFILIQLIPVDRSNPPVLREVAWDSAETRDIAVRACYDCHSNETVWPAYSYVAPISLIVAHHVEDGRRVLNFSDWDRANHADDMIELIESGDMPLDSYLPLHPEAKLTDAEKATLIAGIKNTLANDPAVEPQHGSHDHDH